MKKAKLVKVINERQNLWKLSEKLDGNTYIVTSIAKRFAGEEVYIFPADSSGKITSFGELDGSTKGTIHHETALNNAGYQIEGVTRHE